MKYLVDANVLSEVTRPLPELRVIRWLRDHEAEVVVNPIVLGDLVLRASNDWENFHALYRVSLSNCRVAGWNRLSLRQ